MCPSVVPMAELTEVEGDNVGADIDADSTAETAGTIEVWRGFEVLHPLGWVAVGFLALAVVATIAGWDLLIGRMPWWLWLAAVATVVVSAMPAVLNGIRVAIERVADFTKAIAMFLAIAIFLIQLFNVVTRYANDWFERDILFNQTSSLAWMAFALLFIVGVNYGVRDGINPRIDFWWAEWSDRRKAWLDFVMHTFFFFPFLILGIRVLVPYAAQSLGYNRFANDGAGSWPAGWRVWDSWIRSGNAGELPVGPIQAMILVGFILWAAQILAEMIKTGFIIAGHEEYGAIKKSDAPARIE